MKQRKMAISYLVTTMFLLAFAGIYHIFSHGVVSLSLWLAWLPVVLTGIIVLLINQTMKKRLNLELFRIGFNVLNAGIATVVLGLLLMGIFEIAGTDSPYIHFYYIIGGCMSVVGLFITMASLLVSPTPQGMHNVK